tara:strand:+ start:223 stop:405 length:183 start_codon:yes stop_codon:yes gene_type:complete
MNKKDPFGFSKAINYNKLNDPKILEQLEEIFNEKQQATSHKQQATSSPQSSSKLQATERG